MRELMDFLVADGAEGDHHHVKAVEPAPAFDVVKAYRPQDGEEEKAGGERRQQAEGMQVESAVPGRRPQKKIRHCRSPRSYLPGGTVIAANPCCTRLCFRPY